MNTYVIIVAAPTGLLLHTYQPLAVATARGVARELSRDYHCTVEVFHPAGGEAVAAYCDGRFLYGPKGWKAA